MSNVNTIAISGNLTKDPELRETKGGTAVCNLRLASNRSRKTESGYEDETTFVDVVVWSGFGELVAKKARKGDSLAIQGRIQSREWEADDGTKRSKIEIVADQIDGEAMYRKAGETAADAPFEPATGTETAPVAADDDIPF